MAIKLLNSFDWQYLSKCAVFIGKNGSRLILEFDKSRFVLRLPHLIRFLYDNLLLWTLVSNDRPFQLSKSICVECIRMLDCILQIISYP